MTTRIGREAHWTAESAERELRAWSASGLSLAAYARERGFRVQRLHWWRKRLAARGRRRPEAAPQEPVFVPAIVRSTTAPLLLHGPGGVRLEIADTSAAPASWVAAFAIALANASR